MTARAEAPRFWTVVRLLLAASYRRAMARRRRRRQLFTQRAPRQTDFGQLGFVLGAFMMALLHVMSAFLLTQAVKAGEQVSAERRGWVVVDRSFIDAVSNPQQATDRTYHSEAKRIAEEDGDDPQRIEARLRQTVNDRGIATLMSRGRAAPGLAGLSRAGNLAPLLGSLALLIWFVMIVFQGEGLELDIQRRRHPMWEWLFSHPVPQGAVFLAEMLSPLAANPIYATAPLMPGILYGLLYGKAAGVLAAAVIGIPVTLAAACLGKALEVWVTLRVAARSRGAMIGLMGWLGYATMAGIFMTVVTQGRLFFAVAVPLAPLAALPWPYLGLFLGVLPNGEFSLPFGIAVNLLLSAAVIAASVRFSVWGAARGLTGNPGAAGATNVRAIRHRLGFVTDPLYRKEILWFVRDRSALVQAVLIPFSLAGFQVFNLRRVLSQAGHQWNTLCGAAVVFGTYFLLVLGPKSLASEGAALWISLTWPQGLEKLLWAKARLWTLLATGVVSVVLVYAAVQFPIDAWRVALLGIAWFLFARSMAAKTVTLATVTNEAGEIQKVSFGRRWAAQLGLLTFSIGVISQQWNLVVMGVVYSTVTAAAMWQNFRARLPYLYDPWSEVMPAPPTLMHAMVGISALVELGAVITGGLLVFFSRGEVAVAHAVIYGLCAVAVSVGMAEFLSLRDVPQGAVWNWRKTGANPSARPDRWSIERPGTSGLAAALLVGAAVGVALGGVGLGYGVLVAQLPGVADQLKQNAATMLSVPHLQASLFAMAVLIAPFAEEYLFRGLLYRALDTEWGGWRAVIGSAAFFAAYHPMMAWAPVFLLGVGNALVFKKTGRLAGAVVVHMSYNAIIVLA